MRKDATTNYEVDKTIQHVRKPVGGVKRLSVAVVVNHRKVTDEKGLVSTQPLSEAEKTQITDLVKEAMGFSRERGDSLNVVNSPFTDMEKETIPELPLWQQPEMIELAKQIAKTAADRRADSISGAGRAAPDAEAHESASRLIAIIPYAGEHKEDQPLPSKPVMKQAPQLSLHDQNLALARQLARDDPKMVASVVRHWVAGHE